MRISMWMLLDNLAEYNPTGAINEGKPVIQYARLFSANEKPREDTVYIEHAYELFGTNQDQMVLVNGKDMIIIDHIDAAELMNIVLNIFDRMRDWDSRLKEALHSQNPYQEIMDVANEEIRCPMVLGCKDLTIYAITEQYSDDDVYKGWDEVKTIRTLPVWLIKFLTEVHDHVWSQDKVDPAVMAPWPGMITKLQVRFNCYCNGEVWGHLMIYVNELTNTVKQLAQYVADLYGVLLDRLYDKERDVYSSYYWLSDLLDGKSFEKGAINTLYWAHRWKENDELQLYRIMAKRAEDHNNVMYWSYGSLKERLNSAVTFLYRDSIVIVGKSTPAFSKAARECVAEVAALSGYRCGVSFPFTDITNIGVSFRQAGYAVEYAQETNKERILYFEDVAYDGILHEFADNTDWKLWIDPRVYKLMEMDKEQGRELYSTLVCFLSNKMHMGNTADQLFVHRNTLIKRLGRIEELLGRDLQDAGDQGYLYFCVRLLEAMGSPKN